MKDIRESISAVPSLTEYLYDIRESEQLNEGLKDILKTLKSKFKQVWDYLTGFVARLSNRQSYWCPVSDEGEILPAISPLTIGQAYVDGEINKDSTFVSMGSKGKRITGCKTSPKDAAKLYGSGNSIKYWERMINESEQSNSENLINEVKLHTEDPQAQYNIVDTEDLKDEIAMCFKNKKLARLLIWGAPGIGKTAILNSVLNELPGGNEYNLVVKTLSNETPDNFTLPKYVEVNGEEKATDVPKTWLPVYKPTGDRDRDQMLDDACGKGLLFVDELSRATPQVLNVMLPILNEGVFNGYKLGSGWVIIAASNRDQDETDGSQTQIGNALATRFRQVYYEPTAKSWMKWAQTQKYMSPLLLQWLSMPEHENMSGGKFFYFDANEDSEDSASTKIMCNPRTWTNAMEHLAVYAHTGSLEGFSIFDIPERIIKRTLNQYVPKVAVDSFWAFLQVISKVGNFDQAVHAVWKDGGKGLKIDKKELRLVALPLAQLIITAHSDSFPSAEEFDNLCTWCVDQNSDQLTAYVLDVCKNVYAGMLPGDDQTRGGIFIMRKKLAKDPRMKDPTTLNMYKNAYKAFTSKWGLDLETMPDWSIGLAKLTKKYGAVFASAIVDGAEGLG